MGTSRGGKLSEAQKVFLVQRLACFDSPKEAAEALNKEHGIQITPQATERYDPTKGAGVHVADRLRTLFEATRKRFLAQLDDIPAANRAVRVRRLDRMALAAQQRGNFSLAASLLKQIAEECGNVYSNRRELTGRDGQALELRFSHLTDEQIDARIAQLVAMMRPDELVKLITGTAADTDERVQH